MCENYKHIGKISRKIDASTHLCESLALCENILRRYKRTGISYSEEEQKAINNLGQLLPTTTTTNADGNSKEAQNGIHTAKEYDTNFSDPNITTNEVEKNITFIEHCTNPRLTEKEITLAIVNYLTEMKATNTCRVYHTYNTDGLLDSISGLAVPFNDSTPVGRCAKMKCPYMIANVLYIPLRIDDSLVGCIEIVGGSLAEYKSATYQRLLRLIAIVLRNMQNTRHLSWEMQKCDAMVTMATRLARDTLDETTLIQSIMNTAKILTESDRCSMFLVNGHNSLQAHFEDGNIVSIPAGTGIAGYVARTGNIINISNAYEDERFNPQVDKATGYHTETILCLPVMYEGTTVAVAQLVNKLDFVTDSGMHLPRTFGKRDEELFQTFSMFAAASLRNCRINDNLHAEKKKAEAVLDVVTLLSMTDIRDVDGIVSHVLHGAKKLLGADRSSLFLVDKERNELYSVLADNVSGKEIRFPFGKGIAGTVAATAIGENIADAYKDRRFNNAVDKKLGYHTQSILCEPIVLNGEVLAVVQLVNKTNPDGGVTSFSDIDRDTFKVFSLFAGISINNSHLFEFAVAAGREALELNEMRRDGAVRPSTTSIKNTFVSISAGERDSVMSLKLHDDYDLTSPTFNLFSVREKSQAPLDEAAAIIYHILLGTGLPQKFGCRNETLLNFILQCRKKYRHVPYHNFFHVVDACQTIHTFLYAGGASEFLTELECYVLLLTAMVHDLDHMGVNNSFYLKTDSPLGILSSASGNQSVLEVHHCNLAIEILSDAHSDVFEGLDENGVRLAYRSMIDCVLATDMAKHGSALSTFLAMCEAGFNKEDEDQRRLVMEMLMKAADVSNVTKPFEISSLWAMAVTEEFYRQGDMEKEKGVAVLPMFDRSRNDELAKGQIGFIDFVAGKFFKDIVSHLFHKMQWCVDNIDANREQWKQMLNS